MKLDCRTRTLARRARDRRRDVITPSRTYNCTAGGIGGIISRMRLIAETDLANNARNPPGHDHVWQFHGTAPISNGEVLYFEAFSTFEGGSYSPLEVVWCHRGDNAACDAYRNTVNRYLAVGS